MAFVLLFVAEESSTISWIWLWKARGLAVVDDTETQGLILDIVSMYLYLAMVFCGTHESWELLIHDENGHLA